jgi:hypothetical protein
MLSEISWSEREGSLEGNDGLALGTRPDLFFQHSPVGQIERSIEYLGQAQLQPGHVEHGEPLSVVEIAIRSISD